MAEHCLIVGSTVSPDPRSAPLVADAHALGLTGVTAIRTEDIFHLDGDLGDDDRRRLVESLLTDPVVETAHWREPGDVPPEWSVETSPRPGVTDTVATELVEAAHKMGVTSLRRAASGRRFTIEGLDSQADLRLLARRLLVNDVVERHAFGPLEAIYPGDDAPGAGAVEKIPLLGLDDGELLALSTQRGLSLDMVEMQAIRDHYDQLGREPTDAELEMLAQTWSEHCVHKTFRALIETRTGRVDGLLNTYIRAATEAIDAPWVQSAFVDDAGVIEFDDETDVCFKVETHNHPSAIEPFGGANTGVGGVLRDVLGVSARPIAVTDVLCFGPPDLDQGDLPDGVLHPRRIRSGVVAGVGDYGNKIGVPNIAGAVVYHPDYTTNPLVFAGCIGVAPRGSHPTEPEPGDRIVVIGGATGRDGIGGATFSSRTTTRDTLEVAGANVQIGDPIEEKGLIEVIDQARDARLYNAVTDCGAGGLSSSIGEMAEHIGARVQLESVPLKYAGLAPWEIWLSEAQERMVLAVPDPEPLAQLCAVYEVGFADIGSFTGDRRLLVTHGDETVIDLDLGFVHDGLPRRTMTAEVPVTERPERRPVEGDPADLLLALLAHPSIASTEDIVRTYDHEVLGNTVVRPYEGRAGDGPSDGTVVVPYGTTGPRGVAVGVGVNALHGRLDPYRMAVAVHDEAVRNVVAVGADPDRIAVLDNFSWGDPTVPERLGALVEAARGCHDAAVAHATPFISGKDSLYNEYVATDGTRRPIPHTLVISAIGIVPDVSRVVTTAPPAAGEVVVLVGDTRDELGGSHLDDVLGTDHGGEVPGPDPGSPVRYRALHRAMSAGLVTACHDLSEGGLAVAAAEMCIAGRVGMALELEGDATVELFSESLGRLLLTVRAGNAEEVLGAIPGARTVGIVRSAERLEVRVGGEITVDLAVEELVEAARGAEW